MLSILHNRRSPCRFPITLTIILFIGSFFCNDAFQVIPNKSNIDSIGRRTTSLFSSNVNCNNSKNKRRKKQNQKRQPRFSQQAFRDNTQQQRKASQQQRQQTQQQTQQQQSGSKVKLEDLSQFFANQQQANEPHLDDGFRQQQPQRRRDNNKRKKVPATSPAVPWKSQKSVEELEAIMTKRWGTLQNNKKNVNDKGYYEFDYNDDDDDDDDYEIVYEDDDENGFSKYKSNNYYEDNDDDDDDDDAFFFRKPTKQTPKKEFYDEDDEGYERSPKRTKQTNHDNGRTISLDHVIAPKPAGGRGTNNNFYDEDDDNDDIFFSAPTTPEKKKKKKKKEPKDKAMLDEDGNPMYLTLEQALVDFYREQEESATKKNNNYDLLEEQEETGQESDTPSSSPYDDVENMTVMELKELCKQFGLKVSGKKAELQRRLWDYYDTVTIDNDDDNDDDDDDTNIEEEEEDPSSRTLLDESTTTMQYQQEDEEEASSWEELGITSPILLENLERMECPVPLPVQAKVCSSILSKTTTNDDNERNNNDVLMGTYTGSGKTLAFLVPLAQSILSSSDDDKKSGIQIVIVTPGRELASQIMSVTRELFANLSPQLTSMLAIGGTAFDRNYQQIRKQKPTVLIGTPGRIAELIVGKDEKGTVIKINAVKSLVLDEVDALLQYKVHKDPTQAIIHALKKRHRDSLQCILCSATASDLLLSSSSNTQNNNPHPNDSPFSSSSSVLSFLRPGYQYAATATTSNSIQKMSPTIIHGVVHVPHRRLALETLRKILYTEPVPQQILVFVDNARKVDIVVDKLGEMGIIAAPLKGSEGGDYNNDRKNKNKKRKNNENKLDRAEISKLLREGRIGIVVTTELAARGLDSSYLTHVINFDLPTDASHYAHRAGRCGRGYQNPGVVINLTTNAQERNVPFASFAKPLGLNSMYTVNVRNGKLNIVLDNDDNDDFPKKQQ